MSDFQQLKVHIGKQLRKLRLKRGLTINVLTGLVDMDPSNYLRLENAKNSNPSLDTLCKLAKFHGVSVNYFLQEYAKDVPLKKTFSEEQVLKVLRKMPTDVRLSCLQFLRKLVKIEY